MQLQIAKSVLIAALCLPLSAPLLAAETYTLDPNHTYALWHINHLGFSIQTGKFTMITGKINFDQTKPQNSKVTATIDMNNIDSGIPKLDEHLKSPDFFDVSKYPKATFSSDKIVVTGKDTGKIYGTLTLNGISKPIVLDAKLINIGMYPMKNIKSVGFSATTEVNRSDFGMNKYIPLLGNKVQLEIGAEANLGG